MISDKVFGTFERENLKIVYGLTRNINTNNSIKIIFIEFSHIWNDLKNCRNTKDKLKVVFGGLSWRPEYFSKREN